VPAVPFEPSQVAALIQTTLVPVIMISAVGLVALVVQNRHALVLERTYRINLRRLDLWEALQQLEDSENPARVRWLRTQFEIQEALLDRWLQRGIFTRNSLVFAFLGVFFFGLTVLDLVINVLMGLTGNWDLVTVGFYIAGIVAFLLCFTFALLDVYQGMWITRTETALVSRLLEEHRVPEGRERAA